MPARKFNLKAYPAITWHNDPASPGLEPRLTDHRSHAAHTAMLPIAPPPPGQAEMVITNHNHVNSKLKYDSGGQFSPSVRPHNLATGFRPPSATVVSAEPFLHGTGTLRCLQKEMATYRPVSLWRDPNDDVPHCRIMSPDKTEWRLISATLCGWRRCFVADQLWLMTRMRVEEELLAAVTSQPLGAWLTVILPSGTSTLLLPVLHNATAPATSSCSSTVLQPGSSTRLDKPIV